MIINIYYSLLQCFVLFFTMYGGTKIVNYYYNFYHIYKYLDHEQKLGYFKTKWYV